MTVKIKPDRERKRANEQEKEKEKARERKEARETFIFPTARGQRFVSGLEVSMTGIIDRTINAVSYFIDIK